MRSASIALLAAVVLLLTGCSVIPTTSTVQPGRTEAPNGTKLVYVPNAPTAGASQQEIVSGFLTAASGGGGFSVAKQYLTSPFAKKWDPRTRVLVQEAQATLSGTGADISAQIPISAKVNSAGVYTPTSGKESLPFHLVQVRGQWRIDSADDGIVLTQPVFQQNYGPHLLQFFDPTWTRLVPDRRWFPATRSADGSDTDVRAVVSALIKGPAGPLGGGVTANALKGAEIAGISPSSGGVTTVTLTTDAASPDVTVAARMQQQLVQSLGLSLRLVVDDVVMPQAKPITDQLTPEAYVLTGDRFGTLSPSGAFTEDKSLGPKIAATRPTSITVSFRQRLAAVQTRSGAVELVTAAGTKVVDSRPGLLPPSLDQRGWVYSTSASGALQAGNGKSVSILSADFGNAAVSGIHVSPDGTRLLVLLDAPAGLTAFVAGIERDGSGKPTGLTDSRNVIAVGSAVGSGGAATWIDDDDVAILTNGADTDQVSTQQLGGISGTLGQFANVTSIVGTTSADDLRILVQARTVYVWNDPSWQQQSDSTLDVSVLAVQR